MLGAPGVDRAVPLITATAHSRRLPLYTRDPRDFAVLADELELHVV